jgi:diguanylate cyclase (GGDEF)-like protein
VEQSWIVVLHTAADRSGPAISADALQELMVTMDGATIVALPSPYRYEIRSRIAAASPAEALFNAAARWAEALRQATDPAPTPGAGGEGNDLLRNAFQDPLTGFPTLALFRDQLRTILPQVVVSERQAVLLVVDIDGIGAINRELGYHVGDEALVELAGRLTRQADLIWAASRLGGDEFALLVEDGAGSAEEVARQLLEDLRAPVVVRGRPIFLSASIGMSPITLGTDLDDCLTRAGTAMCAAKEAGGDTFRWHEAGLAVNRARLEFVAQSVPDRLAYVELLERAATAANESATLQQAAAIILRQVLAHTGWLFGHLWLVDHTTGRLEPGGVWQATGPRSLELLRRNIEGTSLATGSGLPATAWTTGRPQWATLTGREPRCAYQEAASAAGVSAAVAFPVLVGSDVVAVLGFCSTRPISPDDSLLGVMVSVAAQLGRTFERAQASAALAEAEERYQMLAESLMASRDADEGRGAPGDADA